jgi:hypothetical protein
MVWSCLALCCQNKGSQSCAQKSTSTSLAPTARQARWTTVLAACESLRLLTQFSPWDSNTEVPGKKPTFQKTKYPHKHDTTNFQLSQTTGECTTDDWLLDLLSENQKPSNQTVAKELQIKVCSAHGLVVFSFMMPK